MNHRRTAVDDRRDELAGLFIVRRASRIVRPFPGLCTFVALFLLVATAASADVIWLEAEKPAATNFPPKNPFAPITPRESTMLSRGNWLGADKPRDGALFAEYPFKVEQAGPHQLYARKFWKHGPFRWRVDGSEWTMVDADTPLLEHVQLRKFIEVNWVHMGAANLPAGEHVLRIELTENKGPASFDCFAITDQPFVPRGKLQPAEQAKTSANGWFAFDPAGDPDTASPVDLRFLNEKFAGEHGRLIARGGEIVQELTGEPVRLWGVCATADVVGIEPPMLDDLARDLARLGVNYVRVHMPVGTTKGPDPAAIDRVQRFVAAMKTQGIYTSLSIYFPVWIKLKAADGFGSYHDKEPFGLIFFDEKFQELYRSWWKALLAAPSPYGDKLALRDDPAVAIVEMVNEDSTMFWTFKPGDTIPAEPTEKLERKYAAWLARKHGTAPPGGRASLVPVGSIARQKSDAARDTAGFLTDLQREFFESTKKFLREDCGYPGMTIGSNWYTADGRILGPLDKWSNTAADVMDRHGYYSGKHEGPRATHAIEIGDKFVDRTATRFDRQEGFDREKPGFNTPIWDIDYNGKPSIISETNWSEPNRFRAEMPLIAAAYGALQSSDGFAFFALQGASWDPQLRKFSVRTPAVMGQFPAAALMYRRGLVKPADAVVNASVALAELRDLHGAPAQQQPNLDALRAKDVPPGQTIQIEKVEKIDPLSFAVGRVELHFTDSARPSQMADVSRFIDREQRIVRSATGELAWDWGRGVITVNSPKAQAACGFLGGAGPIELGDCVFEIHNEYACVMLVSVDDQPLATSKKMLLQVMTEETNPGWISGNVVTDIGTPPAIVKTISGAVKLKNSVTIELGDSKMYYLIERP